MGIWMVGETGNLTEEAPFLLQLSSLTEKVHSLLELGFLSGKVGYLSEKMLGLVLLEETGHRRSGLFAGSLTEEVLSLLELGLVPPGLQRVPGLLIV